MLHKYIDNVVEFRKILESKGLSYILESRIPSSKVYLQVEGVFNGEEVVWNMCIRTIEDYSIDHKPGLDPQQFIDIQRIDGVYHIEIGLNLNEIDRPAIESTIIMIRKYKRLKLGRHEYGARSKTM